MRALLTVIPMFLATSFAFAQQSSTGEAKTFRAAAEVAQLMDIAKKEIDAKKIPNFAQPLLRSDAHEVMLDYRVQASPAAIHEAAAELFYIVEGSATFVMGGKLVNEKRVNATNVSGTGIENGETRKVSQGDFILVPRGTPHWFSAVENTVAYMAIHLPAK